ncbi:acyl carrier protein [Nocardia vermiculata]|uniref:Acyl carrier protein n=1 Tax=Nocardia vermiculata TaxID=257274 RepID=A0A846XT58_9NOCA|nr:acyl carrier protein [Nocardia vermiculata]NKY49242.1 acyl carrier protein [Nocardia vermiculata]
MTDVDSSVGARARQLVVAMAPDLATEPADESRLIEDLGYDSLRLMELTLVLERAFGLPRFRPEQLIDVRRITDVVALIEETRL